MRPADWWELPGAAPLYATRRDPARPSDGPAIGLVADALGTPLLPWQRYSADVATELLPDGRYAYQVVVLTVPRQSGKTTQLRAVGTHRGLSRDDCGVFYSAQTGKDARERWQDLVKAIRASPLAPLATVRSAAGSERVVWPNLSTFRAFAPVPTSLHGYTPPLVMLDEAFAHDEQLGNDLMGAIGPAQQTIPHRQLWIVSTAGTARSTFLRQWVEAGRAGAAGVCHLEWAAGPELDIYDPRSWPLYHPAMVPLADGRQLATADYLASQAAQLSRSEFERAYGNRWTRTASVHIAADAWDGLREDDQRAPAGRVVYAFDVMPDRSAAAVVAAWRAGDVIQTRVAKAGPGMAWVAPAVADLRAAGHRTFAYAPDGPAREVADELERSRVTGLDLRTVTGAEYADAWGQLLEGIARRSFRHDGSDTLAIAAANVATRPMVDRAAPSRRNSAGDVSPIVALMVAMHVLDHTPPPGQLSYRL